MTGMIYIRVSTKEQVDDGNSLETQLRLCLQYAKNNGINIPEGAIFREEGESAKTVNRRKLREMMAYSAAHKNEIDSLIIYKIDRLSREAGDYNQLKTFFNGLGIKVLSTSETIEDNPVGRFIENVLASTAQFDNEIRAERSKNGMVDAVKEGRWVWKAPYGYVNARVEGKKNVAPVNDERLCGLIKEAWLLIDAGYSEMDALRTLRRKGLKTADGKDLSIQTFSKMLRKPIYKGVIDRFGLFIVSESIVPLVEPELWDRVYQRLEGKRNNPPKYLRLNPAYPLRGTLFCSEGHRMTASAPRGNGGVYPKYHCPKCKGKGYSYDRADVEKSFIDYVNQYEYQETLKEALVTACKLNLEEQAELSTVARKKLVKQLNDLDAMDEVITHKNVKGTYSDEHTSKMLAANDLKRVQLRLELNDLSNTLEDAEEIVEFGFSTLTRIGNAWDEIEDVAIKQRFQNWLFPAGLSYDGQKFGTSQIPLCLSIKKELSEENSLLVIPRGISPTGLRTAAML